MKSGGHSILSNYLGGCRLPETLNHPTNELIKRLTRLNCPKKYVPRAAKRTRGRRSSRPWIRWNCLAIHPTNAIRARPQTTSVTRWIPSTCRRIQHPRAKRKNLAKASIGRWIRTSSHPLHLWRRKTRRKRRRNLISTKRWSWMGKRTPSRQLVVAQLLMLRSTVRLKSRTANRRADRRLSRKGGSERRRIPRRFPTTQRVACRKYGATT